jgi:hypothetical protein
MRITSIQRDLNRSARSREQTERPRYVVVVRSEYAAPELALPYDESLDGVFDSADRAEDWCVALNWCAGYDRYGVQQQSARRAA